LDRARNGHDLLIRSKIKAVQGGPVLSDLAAGRPGV